MNYTEEYIEQLEKIMASLRVELRREKRKIEKLQERVAEGDKLIAALKASISEIAAPVGKLAVRTDSLITFFKLTDEELAALAPAPEKPDSSANTDFEIVDDVLKKYKGNGGEVVIPDGVTKIGEGAFWWDKSLTGLLIPDGVRSIGECAFNNCYSLIEVTIPQSVNRIGDYAFDGCADLTIKCKAGSYAERYCRINNIRYITTE